jgi:hypothetical protein
MLTSRCGAFLLLIASVCFLPGCMLHRSAASIRGTLLKQTPVGTHYEAVEASVKSKGWHWEPSAWSGPYRSVKRTDFEAAAGSPTNVVSKEMRAYLGDYRVWPLFQCQVFGYWLFDTKNELMDVYVSKRLADQ